MENTDNLNRVEYELSSTSREKMSQKKKGAMNPNYGKPRSPETIRKISDGMKKHHAELNN